MNEYKAAWIEFLYYRDMLYLLAFMAAATGLYWQRFSRGRLYPVLAVVAVAVVVAGWGWGAVFLWY